MLAEEDFSQPRARATWRAIAGVLAAGRSVTISSVADESQDPAVDVRYLDMLRRHHGELYEGNLPKWVGRLREARAWSRRLDGPER